MAENNNYQLNRNENRFRRIKERSQGGKNVISSNGIYKCYNVYKCYNLCEKRYNIIIIRYHIINIIYNIYIIQLYNNFIKTAFQKPKSQVGDHKCQEWDMGG